MLFDKNSVVLRGFDWRSVLQRFLQCVATRAGSFTVDTFTDRTDVLGEK